MLISSELPCILYKLPGWRNWFTRTTQNRLGATPWEFESPSRHRKLMKKIENNKNNFEIEGGRTLHGSITTNMSKNGSVGLLCASLINSGTTTLHGIARIEEVYRVIEVLESIGVKITWTGAQSLKITPPQKYDLNKLNKVAALKTRSIIMLAGPLIHHLEFSLPHAQVVNSERGLSAHIYD